MKKWLLFVLVLVMMFCLVGCGEMAWPDGRLASMIPQIEGAKGEVSYQDIDNLDIQLEDISESQYLNYLEECKSSGFNIEINDQGSSFSAFNKDGYKIEITYFSDGEMWIWVDAPMTMSNFDWPDSAIAKLLPEPDSNYGNILWENEGGFVIYVGNTTKEEYKNYVNDVYSRGFTVDYDRGENYFYADNAEGYSVSLKYEGFNTMFVRIDEPNKEDSDTNNGNSNSNDNDADNGGSNTGELVNGMNSDFKDAMDSYEAFIDEYCSFMKRYNSSNNPISMLNDYMRYVEKYTEAVNKINNINTDELNSVELAYYTDVMLRTSQKLLELY